MVDTDSEEIREAQHLAVESDADAKPGPSPTEERSITTLPVPPVRSAEDLYTDRLRAIWAVTHADADSAQGRGEFQWFRSVVLKVVDPTSFVSMPTAEGLEAGEEAGAIVGDAGEVQLLVGNDVDRLASPNELAQYVRTRLAPTLSRLELVGEGTREERVDILTRALRPLTGARGLGRLIRDAIVGYLEGQPPDSRGPGFYATMGVLAVQLDVGRNPDMRLSALLLYHRVLIGARAIAIEGRFRDEERLLLTVTSTAAGNSAAVVGMINQDSGAGEVAAMQKVLADLTRIASATARAASVDEQLASASLAAAGLETGGDVVDLVAALTQMSIVAAAWGPPDADLARLEALAGVAWLLSDDAARAVSSMFNAGVSLDRAPDKDDQRNLEAQIALNALALRIALEYGANLVDALVGNYTGLRSAVNLVGTAVTYQSTVSGARWGMVGEGGLDDLLRLFAYLPEWGSLSGGSDVAVQLSLARLGQGARRLRIDAPSGIDGEALDDAAARTLDVLLGSIDTSNAPTEGRFTLEVAARVRQIFGELLDQTEWKLESVFREVAALRAAPLAELVERYAEYIDGEPPPVAAKVTTREEWDRVEAQIVPQVDSVVESLRNFTVD